MTNLRALKIQICHGKRKGQLDEKILDELIVWLRHHSSYTCMIQYIRLQWHTNKTIQLFSVLYYIYTKDFMRKYN